jgi:hypothetical protein
MTGGSAIEANHRNENNQSKQKKGFSMQGMLLGYW